ETAYDDVLGAHYRQESFTSRAPGSSAPTSFVEVAGDARRTTEDVVVRFAPSPVAIRVPRGQTGDIYVAWLHDASSTEVRRIDAASYTAARDSLVRRWKERLAEGMTISVPERRVADAERAVL